MRFNNTSKIDLGALSIEIYGASHSERIGVKCKGLPYGEEIDTAELYGFLKRRSPGQNCTSSSRKESDNPLFISGFKNGVLCGDFCAEILNTDKKREDYTSTSFIPRPGHADYPARIAFGEDYDLSGGGHFSGRMTAPLCVIGGIALQLLKKQGISIAAHAEKISGVQDRRFSTLENTQNDISLLNERAKNSGILTFTDVVKEKMEAEILLAANEGDSLGGVVECAAAGLPTGLGRHMFESIEGRLCSICFAVPSIKGIEFGDGFGVSDLKGSQNNDGYAYRGGKVSLLSNHAGGILGGMTTGAPVIFRVAVKPTPSIFKQQSSVDMQNRENVILSLKGRHDPCIVGRIIPVIEAVCAIALLDFLLSGKDPE